MASINELMPDNTKELVAYVGTTAIVSSLLVKAFTKVEQGELGVRTRFGKAYRKRGSRKGEPYGIVEPDIHPTIPFTHSIKIVNVKDRTSELKDAIFNCEGEVWRADTSVTWSVLEDGENPIKALFNVEKGELNQTVEAICSQGLSNALQFQSKEAIEDLEQVKINAIQNCEEVLLNYGVGITRFNIANPSPTQGEMIKQACRIGGSALQRLVVEGIGQDPKANL